MAANNGNGRWLSAEEAIAAGLADRLTAPTRTLPCEDPSLGDPVLSPNERAYAEDIKQFIR